MKAIICDRCGRVTERGLCFHITKEIGDWIMEAGDIELCEDCYKDIMNNLKEYPKIYSQPTDSKV